jgi:hypothetical protein
MPGCVLHVYGKNLDPTGLSYGSLAPYQTYRRGDPRWPGARRHITEAGGLKCLVSRKEGTDLDGQVEDAVAFLEAHSVALAAVLAHPEVEEAYLDFGIELRVREIIFDHVNYLPPRLVRAAGALGIGLMLSLYPTASCDVQP